MLLYNINKVPEIEQFNTSCRNLERFANKDYIVQVESQECIEKNDQANAKQAEQWASIVRQVGPLVLGNTDTVVLLLFIYIFILFFALLF